MEILIIGLDLILIVVGIWMVYTIRQSGLGGVIGSTLNYITVGAILLGIAHFTETLLIEVVGVSIEVTELIHRLMVLFGFIFLIIGLRQLGKLKA